MSYNPSKPIDYFEPGCITCDQCSARPVDSWDPHPEDFRYIVDTWLCSDCSTLKLVSYGE